MWTDDNNPFTVAFGGELQKSGNKIYHLALNRCSTYLVIFDCLTVQLVAISFSSKAV